MWGNILRRLRIHAPAKHRIASVLAVAIGLSAYGCTEWDRRKALEATNEREETLAAGEPIAKEISYAMARDADPCRDFFQYACGGWIAKDGTTHRGIFELDRRMRSRLAEITGPMIDGSDQTDTGRLVHSIRVRGSKRVQDRQLEGLISQINAISDAHSFMRVLGELQAIGIEAFFETAIVPRFDQPTAAIVQIRAGGLELSDPRIYLNDNPEYLEYRRTLSRYFAASIARLDAGEYLDGDSLLELETSLAAMHPTRSELHDAAATRAIVGIDEISQRSRLPFLPYIEALQSETPIHQVEIVGPRYVEGVLRLVEREGWERIKAYLTLRLVHSDSLRSIWLHPESLFPNEIGHRYAAKYPLEAERAATQRIAVAVQAKAAQFAGQNTFLDASLKRQFADKVKGVEFLIGYPDRWETDSEIDISGENTFELIAATRRTLVRRELKKLSRPIDRREWPSSVFAYTAHYQPERNQVVIPPSFLATPVIDPAYPAELNYGGIGTIIGHEIGHAFDRTGSWYGPDGQMSRTQGQAAAAALSKPHACLRDGYSTMQADTGYYSRVTAAHQEAIPVDSELTQDENFADVIGLTAALAALHEDTASAPSTFASGLGLTRDQLYFVAYAQLWCNELEGLTARHYATHDVHTPSRARVNGAVGHLPEFSKAFGCQQGDPLFREKSCLFEPSGDTSARVSSEEATKP